MCRNEDKRKALPSDSKAQATTTVRSLPENSPFLLLSVSSPLFLCFCLLWLNSGTKPKMGLALCLLLFVHSASGLFCSLCLFCSGFRVFLSPIPPLRSLFSAVRGSFFFSPLRSLIFSSFIARECQASLQLKRLQSHYCRNRSCGRRRRRRWLISRNGDVRLLMVICVLTREVSKVL